MAFCFVMLGCLNLSVGLDIKSFCFLNGGRLQTVLTLLYFHQVPFTRGSQKGEACREPKKPNTRLDITEIIAIRENSDDK